MEIEVKGHSGCNIEIVRNKKILIVEKSTQESTYVDRLYKQAKKQQKAYEIQQTFIRVPKIISITKTDTQMVMQMEYVYSKNFIDYFETAGFEQISYFVNTIFSFIKHEIEQSKLQQIPSSVFFSKFQDVKNKIDSNPFLSENNAIDRLIRQSEDCLTQLPPCMCIPVGVCHGDLTLSNILFNANHYYLIDFLDSFIESPLMDMVKLRQDTAHRWSPLMFEGEYDTTRFNIIATKIDFELNLQFSQYEWYKRYYNVFQLMNMLRVLQYAHEDKTISFLINEISLILDSMKG